MSRAAVILCVAAAVIGSVVLLGSLVALIAQSSRNETEICSQQSGGDDISGLSVYWTYWPPVMHCAYGTSDIAVDTGVGLSVESLVIGAVLVTAGVVPLVVSDRRPRRRDRI